uniref:Uncharacterized protein n=1 Tax=Ditylenchus dipsaci TaxID=166011 RepID=A0A915CV71_9BILA
MCDSGEELRPLEDLGAETVVIRMLVVVEEASSEFGELVKLDSGAVGLAGVFGAVENPAVEISDSEVVFGASLLEVWLDGVVVSEEMELDSSELTVAEVNVDEALEVVVCLETRLSSGKPSGVSPLSISIWGCSGVVVCWPIGAVDKLAVELSTSSPVVIAGVLEGWMGFAELDSGWTGNVDEAVARLVGSVVVSLLGSGEVLSGLLLVISALRMVVPARVVGEGSNLMVVSTGIVDAESNFVVVGVLVGSIDAVKLDSVASVDIFSVLVAGSNWWWFQLV